MNLQSLLSCSHSICTKKKGKDCYFDQLHREIAGEVGPGAPVPEPLDPAATLFRGLVEHENPEQVHDNEGPEVLERAEIEEGDGADGDR